MIRQGDEEENVFSTLTQVNFVCNDEVMASTSEDHLIDPETSIRFTKIRLEVKRSDAMDVLGRFVCKCHAASNKGEVDSREASVSVACKFLKMHSHISVESLADAIS